MAASPWRILLLLVFVITLAVPFFNRIGPTLFGLPFFYWYQIAMVPVCSVLIFIVFLAEDRPASTDWASAGRTDE